VFKILNMRSVSSGDHADLTTRAQIRDRALELFALAGPDGVSVRAIAAAAGVSPGSVLHHFGSKQGLQESVNAHVTRLLDDMLTPLAEDPSLLSEGRATGTIAGMMLDRLPVDSPIPGYLRWLLLSGDDAGRELFRRWYMVSANLTRRLTDGGILKPSADPEVRSAFMLVNDVAVLLLRDHLRDVLGVDPISSEGIHRWADEVVAAYTEGVFTEEVS
jgi:TetR/AcrR family transcriptional regulator, regulator of cefoperazone and chloramphenicol sensitivity